MKKLLTPIVLLGCGLSFTPASAQNHHVSAGIGLGSTNHFYDAISDVLLLSIPSGVSYENKSVRGEYRLGYAYRIWNRLDVGASVSYSGTQSDTYVGGVRDGDMKRRFTTFAVEGRYYYIHKNMFRLYGLAGLGATQLRYTYTPLGGRADNDAATVFNFHISPVGIELGRRIGGFAEVGFGYRGLITAGIYARF